MSASESGGKIRPELALAIALCGVAGLYFAVQLVDGFSETGMWEVGGSLVALILILATLASLYAGNRALGEPRVRESQDRRSENDDG